MIVLGHQQVLQGRTRSHCTNTTHQVTPKTNTIRPKDHRVSTVTPVYTLFHQFTPCHTVLHQMAYVSTLLLTHSDQRLSWGRACGVVPLPYSTAHSYVVPFQTSLGEGRRVMIGYSRPKNGNKLQVTQPAPPERLNVDEGKIFTRWVTLTDCEGCV